MRYLAILLFLSIPAYGQVAPFVFVPPTASTPIALDTAKSDTKTSGTSHTLTVVIGSGANNYVVAGAMQSYCLWDSVKVDTTNTASNVKMTQLVHRMPSANWYISLFGLKDVKPGTRTFTFYTSNVADGFTYGIVSLSGVNQTTSTGDTASSTGSSETPSVTIANDTGNWLISIVGTPSAKVFTATSPQVLAVTENDNANNVDAAMGYTPSVASAAAWSMDAGQWSVAAVEIIKAP